MANFQPLHMGETVTGEKRCRLRKFCHFVQMTDESIKDRRLAFIHWVALALIGQTDLASDPHFPAPRISRHLATGRHRRDLNGPAASELGDPGLEGTTSQFHLAMDPFVGVVVETQIAAGPENSVILLEVVGLRKTLLISRVDNRHIRLRCPLLHHTLEQLPALTGPRTFKVVAGRFRIAIHNE